MHAENDGSGKPPNLAMSTTDAARTRDSYCLVMGGASSGDYSESVALYYGVEGAKIEFTASYQPWSKVIAAKHSGRTGEG